MSKRNRERRAANKRRKAIRAQGGGNGRQNDGRRGPSEPRQARGGIGSPSVDDLIWAAVGVLHSEPSRLKEMAAVLVQFGDGAGRRLQGLVAARVAELWPRGWTPQDLVRVTSRRLGAAEADVVAGVAVDDGLQRLRVGQAVDPSWQAQLDQLVVQHSGPLVNADLDAWLSVLGLVSRLPDVPRTMPAPGEKWMRARRDGRRIDEGLLGRVRGLLAKAESTEFEAEAEALTAKAQELIARHAIDQALLVQPDDIGEAAVRRVPVDDPYAEAKAVLAARVAEANRCRSLHCPEFGWCDVFGYDADLDAVELLFASLLAQATGAMARHGSRVDLYGRSSTRSFRRSFLFGFAHRIGHRLRETTEAEVAQAAASEANLLPVLASREEHVRLAQERAFPKLVSKRTTLSNEAGYVAGQVAADQAELNVTSGRLDAGV